MTKRISLSQGKFTLVDDEDYRYLKWFKWTLIPHNRRVNTNYAGHYRQDEIGRPIMILMHRIINQTPDDLETDHINNNGLDNRKINLRSATRMQNAQNSNKRHFTINNYKGAHPCKNGKWISSIKTNGKSTYLGTYDKEIDAAKAYNKAAKRCFGEFARLNKIQEKS